MLSAKEQKRLKFATDLRLEADGSEAVLRAELRTSYYSLLHVADVLFGDVNHDNVIQRIASIDVAFEDTVRRSKQLRMFADYDPHFLERQYQGELDLLRLNAREHIKESSAVFQRLMLEVSKKQEQA